MFDVSWTDPTRETIGERRSRKEQEQSIPSPPATIRPSTASTTSTKRRPAILTLFNGKGREFVRPKSRAHVSLSSSDHAQDALRTKSSSAALSTTTLQEYTAKGVNQSTPMNNFLVPDTLGESEHDIYSPYGEPSFSSWATQSVTTESSWSSMEESARESILVQPLSPTSFVTQSTEVTVASRYDIKESEQHVTIVHISSDGSTPTEARHSPMKLSPSTSTSALPLRELPLSQRKSNVNLRNDAVVPRELTVPTPSRFSNGKASPSDLWKPPENWACPLDDRVAPQIPPKSDKRALAPVTDHQSFLQSEWSHLQRSIRRMDAAGSKIVLERLTEEWTEIEDAVVRKELDCEKQLWMLTALRASSRNRKTAPKPTSYETMPSLEISRPLVTKLLSLYEDHASASFLSAVNPTAEVHHLSIDPLSPISYPNVHPQCVPGPSPKLSYASTNFTSIHAISLPALLPTSSIPTLLKECHRTLLSTTSTTSSHNGGSLHLTIVDPSPLLSTTGPKLRSWLDKHLIIPLERHFRCTNPCRLFPIWLADAGLAGRGSSITSVRFAAATETSIVSSYNRGGEETVEELRRVVGRMLWEGTWGRWVVGGRHWWEDKEVMEECVTMGTMWEYLVIEAVKE